LGASLSILSCGGSIDQVSAFVVRGMTSPLQRMSRGSRWIPISRGPKGKTMAKILIIEDDLDLIYLLKRRLEEDGYEVFAAQDGVDGLQSTRKHNPHLILLDLMMPHIDGWETCRSIRKMTNAPVLMLTALDGDANKIRGLDLGADDYVTKPFSLNELTARIRALLRRSNYPVPRDGMFWIDDRLAFDRRTFQLLVDGDPVALSPKECGLLTCFLDNIGRVLTHEYLLSQVWGWEYTGEVSYLKVYVHSLRKKIEIDLAHPRYLLTERGLGYRFDVPTA
jgi:DNA-binding response OmpR family regulator